MRRPNRITVTGAAAVAALVVAMSVTAGPAAAAEVTASPVVAPVEGPGTPTGPGVVAPDDEVEAQASTWKPGVEKTDDGQWVAFIEAGSGFVREDVGTYPTRREARKAAKAAADAANGVVAGPGCDTPPVVC